MAFEVAKGLMNAGYLVSDVILLDAVRSTEPVYTSQKEIGEGVNRLLDVDKIDPWLKEFLDIEAVKDRVKAKIGKYIAYTDQLVNEGMIEADIHFIVAEAEESYEDCWLGSTLGECVIYEGYGKYNEMLKGESLERNVEMICEILR